MSNKFEGVGDMDQEDDDNDVTFESSYGEEEDSEIYSLRESATSQKTII